MMDWDSHINVKYSGSGHCVQYLYKYLFKGPAQRERIEKYSEQEHDSHDEIKYSYMDRLYAQLGQCGHASSGNVLHIAPADRHGLQNGWQTRYI
jgi:hypothetical protein